jgi:hypothetical protein
MRVFAVGWGTLERNCPHCGGAAQHKYRQLPAAGLCLIAVFACWGLAYIAMGFFNLSSNAMLVVSLALLAILSFALGGKLVDSCSTWECSTNAPQATER